MVLFVFQLVRSRYHRLPSFVNSTDKIAPPRHPGNRLRELFIYIIGIFVFTISERMDIIRQLVSLFQFLTTKIYEPKIYEKYQSIR